MPVETDADRQLFMAADDWAVPVAWATSDGIANFFALFDDVYQLIASDFVDGGAEGSSPQLTAAGADIPPSARHGDLVTVEPGTPKARPYRVVEFKPDGTGMTVVRLQEA